MPYACTIPRNTKDLESPPSESSKKTVAKLKQGAAEMKFIKFQGKKAFVHVVVSNERIATLLTKKNKLKVELKKPLHCD